MMKGFGSRVVDRSTFEISNSGNEVNSAMNRRFGFRMVKIDGGKTFCRSEIQGRMLFLDLQSRVNWSNLGGLILSKVRSMMLKNSMQLTCSEGEKFSNHEKG